jgi:WD40 repeat protein
MLWNVATRKLINNDVRTAKNVKPHQSRVLEVKFARDGKRLISADAENHILVWEIEFSQDGNKLTQATSNIRQAVTGYLSKIQTPQSISISPETLKWAIGGCANAAPDRPCSEGEVSVWNLTAHLPISHFVTDRSVKSVNCVAFNPTGKILASGTCAEFGPEENCISGEVKLWDTDSHQLVGQLKGTSNAVTSLAYSPDGKLLAAGSCANAQEACKQGEILLWNPDTPQIVPQPLAGHSGSVSMLAFSPNGKFLASSDGNNIILWNVENPQIRRALAPGHQYKEGAKNNLIAYQVGSIAFSPDSQILVSSGCGKIEQRTFGEFQTEVCSQGEIRLWNVANLQSVGEPLKAHKDQIRSVAFIPPDGKILASAAGQYDGTIKLWQILAQPPVEQTLEGEIVNTRKIVFSPDGKTLASATSAGDSDDHYVMLWDVAKREILGNPLAGHVGLIQDIAFSPDGRILASGGSDGRLLFWDTNLDSWRAGACGIANRNMTRKEWKRYFQEQSYRKTCPNLPEPPEEEPKNSRQKIAKEARAVLRPFIMNSVLCLLSPLLLASGIVWRPRAFARC